MEQYQHCGKDRIRQHLDAATWPFATGCAGGRLCEFLLCRVADLIDPSASNAIHWQALSCRSYLGYNNSK